MLGRISKATVFRHTHVKGIHIHWSGDCFFEEWVDGKKQETFVWEDGKLRSLDNGLLNQDPGEWTTPTELQAECIALSFFEEQGYR